MKFQIRVLAVTLGLFFGATAFAQSAAPAVKASAAVSSSAASVAKESTAPTAKTSAAPMAKTSATPAAKSATPAMAVGGGDGKVWVNTKSKTYHCEGTKYYGKTKVGEYQTEADAKAKGNHADHGKACAK